MCMSHNFFMCIFAVEDEIFESCDWAALGVRSCGPPLPEIFVADVTCLVSTFPEPTFSDVRSRSSLAQFPSQMAHDSTAIALYQQMPYMLAFTGGLPVYSTSAPSLRPHLSLPANTEPR